MARLVVLVCLLAPFVRPLELVETTQAVEIADPAEVTTNPATDPLSRAIDCLARGDDSSAATHLARHVAAHPDQIVYRAQLGEVLTRLDRLSDAQAQFEAAAAAAQDGPPASRNRLVQYHTRLMEIARLRGDRYGEKLHRGIGLYLVAARLKEAGKTDDAERLLFKAAGALQDAQSTRPDDARPAWYLFRVWTMLDQPRPAERSLRKAAAMAAFSPLTPCESRELALATPRGIAVK